MRIIALTAFVLFTAFCIIVAVSNRTTVFFSLHPLPIGGDVPLYLLLFAGIFIGLGAGAMVVMVKSVKHAHQNRQHVKKIRELTKTIHDIENQARDSSSPDNS